MTEAEKVQEALEYIANPTQVFSHKFERITTTIIAALNEKKRGIEKNESV